jgi:hypothetical protein
MADLSRIVQTARASGAGGIRPKIQRQSREKRLLDETRRQVREQQMLNRLGAVRVPMVAGARVQDPLPGMQVPVAADPSSSTIYSDGPMDRFTAAHESAHLLEKVMTDRDKQRFAKVMGMPDRPWEIGDSGAMGHQSTGYRGSLSEVMADWAAMLSTRHDPQGQKVVAGYIDSKDMPSRKQLLRLGKSLERFGDRNHLDRYVRPHR